MTGQTVTSAVAVRSKHDQLIDWVRGQQDEIAMVAASHVKPSSVVRVVHGALRKNPKLMAAAIANPQSLLYAMLDAARLGHEPDTDEYYLVPFGNEVTGIEGYKGIIERMYRAGGVSVVSAEVVRKNDVYRSRGSLTPPIHEYDDFASPEERGPLRGAYAYAMFPGGQCSQVIRMGRAEVMAHKAKSKGSDKADSPWIQWEDSMWKKCPLRGLEVFVPTSSEYRTAITQQPALPVAFPVPAISAAVTSGHPQPAPGDGDICEAELIDEPPSDEGAKQEAPPKPVTAQQVNAEFKRLGYTARDAAEVLHIAVTIAGRSEPISAIADLGPAELRQVHQRLAGCGEQGDVVALMVQIADSRGPAESEGGRTNGE